VLKIELPWLDEVFAAKSAQRLPVVLTPTEARRLLDSTSGACAGVRAGGREWAAGVNKETD
jgi:hypothetical protein